MGTTYLLNSTHLGVVTARNWPPSTRLPLRSSLLRKNHVPLLRLMPPKTRVWLTAWRSKDSQLSISLTKEPSKNILVDVPSTPSSSGLTKRLVPFPRKLTVLAWLLLFLRTLLPSASSEPSKVRCMTLISRLPRTQLFPRSTLSSTLPMLTAPLVSLPRRRLLPGLKLPLFLL